MKPIENARGVSSSPTVLQIHISARKMYRASYIQEGLLDKKFRHNVKEGMQAISLPISCLLAMIFLALSLPGSFFPVQGQLKDPNLTIEIILSGIETPTAMAFLGPDDMLVIEKDTGKVQRIQNGEIAEEPLLDVSVANQVERGLLGIAVSKNLSENKTYVFLYYTEAESDTVEEEEGNNGDGEESNGDNGEPVGNRLYRYELSEDGNKLINPKLLLDMPYKPGPAHNGGTIAIGGHSDNNICVVIGNLEVPPLNEWTGDNLAQNVRDGEDPDGRAGIICVTPNGQKINYNDKTEVGMGGGGILGDKHPLDMYYAYGIRNSFGIAFDPVTGNLWDTENGGYDEINLVEPGFNSGFSVITGSSQNSLNKDRFDEDDLVDFEGKGTYSDPELDLGQHVVPTAIVLYDSDVLGEEYENDIFVATYTGKILHFDFLDENRTELVLEDELADKMADTQDELEDVTFVDDMGSITDLKVGPEGYLYATLFGYKTGDIVRIVPQEANARAEE
jgi:glucose/arabinose dehydrogenase